jgi:hypothetical protein
MNDPPPFSACFLLSYPLPVLAPSRIGTDERDALQVSVSFFYNYGTLARMKNESRHEKKVFFGFEFCL